MDSYRTAATRTIEVDGVAFAYRELGPRGHTPLILLVHLAATLDNWDAAVVDPLAERRHVIAFDNRGVGATGGSVPDTIEAMAEDTARFIGALGYERVDVLGLSMGGMIAQSLVLRHPHLVRRLILAGTGPQGGTGIDKVAGLTYREALAASLTRRDAKELLFFNRNRAGKAAAKAFIARLDERTTDRDTPIRLGALRTQLRAITAWGRGAPDDLARIAQSTLIVNGDDDRMVPSALSEDLHRRIPGSELIIYPDAGHGSVFQRHEAFTRAALDHLER
jgi:pimeloyl-ACP methyl ester carboxylesterase